MILQTPLKMCCTCKVEKELIFFHKKKTTKDGLYPACKECKKEADKKYNIENKEKIKIANQKYREINIEKIKESQKIFYENNKDKIIQKTKEYSKNNKVLVSQRKKKYREENKEYIKAWQKEYREKNKDILYANNKQYREANKEKIQNRRKEYFKEYNLRLKTKIIKRNCSQRRRALKRVGDVNSNDLFNLQQNAKVCYWCNTSLTNKTIHIDHYIPLSKGGKHTLSNLVVSCNTCNLKKGAKSPFEFANSVGKLL